MQNIWSYISILLQMTKNILPQLLSTETCLKSYLQEHQLCKHSLLSLIKRSYFKNVQPAGIYKL